MRNSSMVLGLLVLMTLVGCQQTSELQPSLLGPYLGQQPPGRTPAVFAPGFVSTGMGERDAAMTPDGTEFYFSRVLGGAFTFSAILVTRQVEGEWMTPEVASFSGQYMDLEPTIAPDGKTFYFMSRRPLPGSSEPMSDENIWMMDRVDDGWGEPYPIGPPINSDRAEFFASVTTDGTIYFTRRGDDRTEKIFRSRLVDGEYQAAEELPAAVNAARTQFNAFIAPDESYLIVCNFGHSDSLGGVDYFVVFRDKQDRWSQAIALEQGINHASGQEWSPYVSPDGRYFFFMSSRASITDRYSPERVTSDDLGRMHNEAMNGNPDIWWVDASVVHDLRSGAAFD
ncbi:MAG: hypothetical protein OEV00_11185 [Acidobacteriota bacterium]|nr:hypothetical protein [Acidobacteriota bacterium]MDH3785876.1 hypothetical protein [Acidobacteriota bacterium]